MCSSVPLNAAWPFCAPASNRPAARHEAMPSEETRRPDVGRAPLNALASLRKR
jgi:hypothetical protein